MISQEARPFWLMGCGVGLIYLAFLPPGIASVDGNSMLAVADSLTRHGTFAVSAELVQFHMADLGRGNQYFSPWYPLLSILSIPFIAVGLLVANILHMPIHFLEAAVALCLPVLLMSLTTALIMKLGVLLGAPKRMAAISSLSFAFATNAMLYGRYYLADILLAFLTAAGLFFLFKPTQRSVLWASIMVGLAILAKPSGIVLGPIFAVYLLIRKRPWRHWALPLLGTLFGAGIYSVYNFYRWGNAAKVRSEFLFSWGFLPHGLVNILFSPGAGVVWFCPPLLIVLWAIYDGVYTCWREILTIVAVFCGYWFLHAFWQNWWGGWSWGPRLMLPAFPGMFALLALLKSMRGRSWLIGLTVLGFLIHAPMLFSSSDRYISESMDRGIPYETILSSPKASPLLHAWPAAIRQIRDARHTDVHELMAHAGTPNPSLAESKWLRSVGIWWWMLPLAKIPRWMGVFVSAALVCTGIWMIRGTFLMSEDMDAS